MVRIEYNKLHKILTDVFVKLGIEKTNSEIISKVLIESDLRGIKSHGAARLKRYVDGIRNGMMIPESVPEIRYEDNTITRIDANNGMGQPAAYLGMKKAIEKADNSNIGVTVVNRSNHYGIAGYYSMMALEKDMIGISMTNAGPLVVPTFGVKAMLGTNPISVAVPAKNEFPYVLDMATSVIPLGKVEVYRRKEENLKNNWVIDEKGNDSLDPVKTNELLKRKEGGGILPLGGKGEEHSGYKGYGLGLMVEIFTAVLSGALYSTNTYPKDENGNVLPSGLGHFFAAFKISNFRNIDDFKADMDDLIHTLQSSPKIKNEEKIYIHGEKEYLQKKENMKLGVPLEEKVYQYIEEICEKLKIEID